MGGDGLTEGWGMSRTQEDGLPEYLSSPDYFGLEPTARQLDQT